MPQLCRCGSCVLVREPASWSCPICGRRTLAQGTDAEVWLQDVTDAAVNSLAAMCERVQGTRRPGNALMDRYLDGPPARWVAALKAKDRADEHEQIEVWVKTELDRSRKGGGR